MYIVIGLEVFNYAEIRGIHSNKKDAISQAEFLQKNKKPMICQNYKVVTQTDVKKNKITLF